MNVINITSSRINTVCQMILALAAIATAYYASQGVKGIDEATQGIQELATARSREVFNKVEVFSPVLAERRYLFHEFGARATVDIREIDEQTATGTDASTGILHISINPWGTGAYGGVNFFGNSAITGRFVPVDLGTVEQISFWYDYPKVGDGTFFLKVKDSTNFEISEIPLIPSKDSAAADGFNKFVLVPREHQEINNRIRSNNGRFLVMNLSIATNFDYEPKWSGTAEIRVRGFEIVNKE